MFGFFVVAVVVVVVVVAVVFCMVRVSFDAERSIRGENKVGHGTIHLSTLQFVDTIKTSIMLACGSHILSAMENLNNVTITI